MAQPIETRIKCPYCAGTVGPESTICPDCQEDLAALFRLEFEHVILYNQALSMARNGQWRGARNKLQAALEVAPDFARAHRLLTKLHVQEGDWEEAHRALVRGLEAVPGDAVMLEMQPLVLRGVRHHERRYERQHERGQAAPATAPARDDSKIGATLGLGAALMSGLWLVWRLIGPADKE